MSSIGFESAPITQFITIAVLVCGLFFGGAPEWIGLDIFSLGTGQFWRLLTGQLVFENMAQTAVGAMLLYTFRQFERQMGSRKFGGFVVISMLASTVALITVAVLAMSIEAVYIPASGPFALIFAALALFYNRIPKMHASEYHVLGVGFSEKSWIYLLAMQLLFSAGLRSFLPALTGSIVGYMYDRNLFSLQSFRLPRFVENAFSMVGGFVLSLLPSIGRGRPPPGAGGGRSGGVGGVDGPGAGAMGQDRRGGGLGGMGGMGGGFMASPPPSEESITTLMGMGFDRAAVIRALETTGNNVEAAANILLR